MSRRASWALLTTMILLFIIRVVTTYRTFNDTVDENFHLTTGLEYVQHLKYTIGPQHPPLGRLPSAALAHWVGGLELPATYKPGLLAQDTTYYTYIGEEWRVRGPEFYWKTLSWARAGTLVFAVLTLLFVFLWARDLYGEQTALAATAIASLCPTMLAHSGLITVDVPVTGAFLMAAYFLWRWSRAPGWRNCVLAALATACAITCKFSAVAFLPPVAGFYFVIARWRSLRKPGLPAVRLGLKRAVVFAMVAGIFIWGTYLFQVGQIALPPEKGNAPHPAARSLGQSFAYWMEGRTVPAPAFWQGLLELVQHNEKGHPAFLLGENYRGGKLAYFPLAVGVKSTLPELLLFAYGVWLYWRYRHSWARDLVFALVPVAVILLIAMSANLNIGVRHVLPLYPFLAIAGAAPFAAAAGSRRFSLALASALLLWHAGESLAASPDYLAYFNEVARGREEQVLGDSNLDWGQDLNRLGIYMRENHIPAVRLIYGVFTYPEVVGVNAEPLPPQDPNAGWVAVGVTQQQRQKLLVGEPRARIGKSLWLYRVDPHDPLYQEGKR